MSKQILVCLPLREEQKRAMQQAAPEAEFRFTVPADVTAEDILTDWMDKVLGVLRGLCLTLGVPVGALDGAWTYSNINQIEALILACKGKVDLLQRQAALTVYAGDGYCGQGDYYVGGF